MKQVYDTKKWKKPNILKRANKLALRHDKHMAKHYAYMSKYHLAKSLLVQALSKEMEE